MTASRTLAAFDVCGPLPTGVTVLEASAGTGKTFAIAALAARYVAEGTPLRDLLLVTFTRMATGELRERVRRRLVGAEEALSRARGGAPGPEDVVLRLLTEGSPQDLERRRANLALALTDFDAAAIATTHGFCDQVLAGLGVAGDIGPDMTFVESLEGVTEEVVDDLYLTRFRGMAQPPFKRAEALRIAKAVVTNPFAHLGPDIADETPAQGVRRRFAVAVRAEIERRKRRGNFLTFDDHLDRLRRSLADGRGGAEACARLRDRYRVALVDEFQDTDPVQWEILRRAFGDGGTTLVLIGDPKQAIYAFRGADVYAYLDARRQATSLATLGTNWRSDKGLLDAYDALFGGASLGHEDIPYRRVRASPLHREPGLSGARVASPLRVRIVDRTSDLFTPQDRGKPGVDALRPHVATDLAADVVRLLSSGAEIVTHRPHGAPRKEGVRPGHIAVLVRRNADAEIVRGALDAVGVPAVINGAGSVFATPTAREWLRLLEALEQPASSTAASAVALTAFVGWDAASLASAGEAARESLHVRLHRWAGLLRTRGVASLLEAITRGEGLPHRMLAGEDGERDLTDLRHVGQLLHAAAMSEQLGIAALSGWLRQRIADVAEELTSDERSRRLETDDEAVQVRTIHGSKGLEFPIVYCPYLWNPSWVGKEAPPVYHDAGAGDRRTVDVGGVGPGLRRHAALMVEEQRGEDLRLAYVALTRAQHQAVVWWAGGHDSGNSPLGRLLFPLPAGGNAAAGSGSIPEDAAVTARLHVLAREAPGCISVEPADGQRGPMWAGVQRPPAALEAATFDRSIDGTWRRTSYSAITSSAHEAWVSSEPEEAKLSDEGGEPIPLGPPGSETGGAEETELRSVAAPLAGMPGGVDVGTFIHAVLETTDFAAPGLDEELRRTIGEQQARLRVEIGSPERVVGGLRSALETPLGPLAGERCLRGIGRPDRLDEVAFEFPLAGGDTPKGELSVRAIALLLREHLPAGDPLAGYAARLGEAALQGDFRGYLAGVLDLVVRTRDPDGTQRFAVVDYKTNWLGGDGDALSAWHYRPAALVQEMERAHYPLQALLYVTALHRYLRWRLPGYSVDRNLAGVLYLFLRGMTGAATPRVGGQRCGVFSWRPPGALVEALSDLLDRGRP